MYPQLSDWPKGLIQAWVSLCQKREYLFILRQKNCINVCTCLDFSSAFVFKGKDKQVVLTVKPGSQRSKINQSNKRGNRELGNNCQQRQIF